MKSFEIEYHNKKSEIEKNIRIAKKAISMFKDGHEYGEASTKIILEARSLLERFTDELKILKQNFLKEVSNEIGEDAESWLKSHGFEMGHDRSRWISNGLIRVIKHVSLDNSWTVAAADVAIHRGLYNTYNETFSGPHPSVAVNACLYKMKEDLLKSCSEIRTAVKMINFYNEKCTLDIIHNE